MALRKNSIKFDPHRKKKHFLKLNLLLWCMGLEKTQLALNPYQNIYIYVCFRQQYLQGVPEGTDTFQSFIINKLDGLRKFFS